MQYRDKQFKSRLKTHGGAYRSKLKVDEEEIKRVYREKRSIQLGDYRHNSKCVSYDAIVNKIVEKWESRDKMLCLELIHSVQNKCNTMILEVILNEERRIIEEEYDRKKIQQTKSNSKR